VPEAKKSPEPAAEVKNGVAVPPFPHTSPWSSASLIKHMVNFTYRFGMFHFVVQIGRYLIRYNGQKG
jgi:hypothetical protein